jgi:hypothetical protein
LTSKSDISSVTQRMYRGFKRNPLLIEQVRQEFLKRKSDMFQIMDDLKPKFERDNEFENAKNYIQNFFNILANEKEFKTEILDQLRS